MLFFTFCSLISAFYFCHKIESMKQQFFNTITSDDEVSILLYGEVGQQQQVDSARVVSELLALSKQYDKIDVRINSNGGDVFSGMAIYNALRTSKANITIYVDGVAASIAGIIALCGKPLYMSPYAKLMLHSVSGGTYGNASEFRRMADLMESLEGDLATMIADRCGMKKEEVLKAYFDEKDHWFSAQEALQMKLIDGIYELPAEAAPLSDKTEEIYNYFNNRLQVQSNHTNMAIFEELKKIPFFANVAGEGEAVALVRQLENKATKVEALEKAVAGYKERIEKIEAKEVEAFIDKAIAEHRITAEQKDSFLALMKSDRDNTEKLINSLKPQPARRAAGVFQGGSPDSTKTRADKTWDELDKAGKLSDLRRDNFDLFKAKYKEAFGLDYNE